MRYIAGIRLLFWRALHFVFGPEPELIQVVVDRAVREAVQEAMGGLVAEITAVGRSVQASLTEQALSMGSLEEKLPVVVAKALDSIPGLVREAIEASGIEDTASSSATAASEAVSKALNPVPTQLGNKIEATVRDLLPDIVHVALQEQIPPLIKSMIPARQIKELVSKHRKNHAKVYEIVEALGTGNMRH